MNRQSVRQRSDHNTHGLVELALLAVYLAGVKTHGIMTVGILVKNFLQGCVFRICILRTRRNSPLAALAVAVQPGGLEFFSNGLYLRDIVGDGNVTESIGLKGLAEESIHILLHQPVAGFSTAAAGEDGEQHHPGKGHGQQPFCQFHYSSSFKADR